MGNEIREARLAAGLTQEQLASYSGVAAPNIAAYELGTRKPSPQMHARLLRATRRPSILVTQLADQIKKIMADAGATNVRVFGSIARGEDTPNSDVDLLYDPAPEADMFTIAAAWTMLQSLLDTKVDLVSARAVPARKQRILLEAVPL